MKPKTQRRAATVGLFVTLGIGISLAALAAVGNLSDLFARRTAVVAHFETVEGLKAGDAVWFSGVPVGTVKAVALGPASKVRVDLVIEQGQADYIPHDVFATLSSDGLIGNAIVVLAEGTVGSKPLADGSELKVTPSLSATQLMAEFQQTNKKLQLVIDNLDRVTQPLAEGEGTVGRLIQDDALYADAARILTDLRGAARSAEVATARVSTFTAHLNRPGTLAHDLATDDTSYASLQRSVASIETTAAGAGGIASSLEASASDPHTPIGVLLHDREAGGDLEQTLAEVQRSSVLLSDNLEAMQHNILLRGFFRKREKKAARQRGDELAEEAVSGMPAATPAADGLVPR